MLIDFPSPARLPAAWNCYLAAGLRALRGQHDYVFADGELESAAGELQALPARALLRLEEAVRKSPRDYDFLRRFGAHGGRPFRPVPVWPDERLPLQALQSASPERAQACLFVASCDYDGYLREYALRAFADWPGRVAMAAALIRCGDWADPVRRVAENLLDSLLRHEPERLFDLIELALSMRGRERYADAWSALVEPELHAPRHAERLWQATASDSPQVREYVYAAAVSTGARSEAEACIAALDDTHPRIACAALAQAQTLLTPEQLDRELRLTRRRRVPALRRDALRLAARVDAPSLRESLDDALFDRSTGPRRVAAYLLRERFNEEPRRMWRDALEKGDSARARIALAALSECALPEDEASLSPWLSQASSRLRLLALRGLIRGAALGLPAALARALHDIDSRVASEALRAYTRGHARLTTAVLRQAWELRPQRRDRLTCATTLLDKWQALDFLLDALCEPQAPQVERELLSELRIWANFGRYRFGSLEQASPQTLRERLQQARTRLPDELHRELEPLIPR